MAGANLDWSAKTFTPTIDRTDPPDRSLFHGTSRCRRITGCKTAGAMMLSMKNAATVDTTGEIDGIESTGE